MRKNWWFILGLVCVLGVLGIWGLISKSSTQTLQMRGHTFKVEYADTPMTQERGLGGRDSLPADHAMLFRFAEPAKRCFWMKDMRFSLDIIWLNTNKKVVHIEPNVTPQSYPKNYCPTEPAQYVLETNSGVAQKLRLHNGDAITE